MADIVDVNEIINDVRAACDEVGSQNPPDSTPADPGLLSVVNRKFKRLYDQFISAYPQNYEFAQANIVTIQGQQNYNLSTLIPNFYKGNHIDILLPGGGYAEVLPFKIEDRNLYGQPSLIQGGQTLLVSYVPKAPKLQQYATLSLNSANGIDGILFTAATPGSIGLNVSVQIVLSGSAAPAITAPVSPYALVLTIKTSGDTIVNILSALATSQTALNVVTATGLTSLATDSFTTAVAATQLGGTVSFDFISGFQDYLVSACAADVLGRQDLDPSFHIAERNDSMANITSMAAIRDTEHPDELRDVEMEGMVGYSMAALLIRSFRYRFEGTNLTLRALIPGMSYL